MGGVGFRSSWIGWSAVFPKRRLARERNWWQWTADHGAKRIFVLISRGGNLQDITIASYSMGEPGTILQSTKTTVYLDSGSRLLLLVQ
jgi:hypothetical protein